MRLSDLYAEYFANWISNGGMINRDKISLLGIRPLYDQFLTNKYVTKVWMVIQMPVHFDKNLTQMIRTEMHERFPEVKTTVHLYNSPVVPAIYSEQFKRYMGSAASNYYKYEDIFNSLTEVEKETGVSQYVGRGSYFRVSRDVLNNIRDKYDSYMYVHNQVSNGKTFVNTAYFIQASCENKQILRKYGDSLMQLMMKNQILVKPLKGKVGHYLNNYCPATHLQANSNAARTILLSQENVAAMMPNITKGLVSEHGLPIAIDWQTKLPFFLDLTSSGTAQVIMIVGKSGCGKTFLAFIIVICLVSVGIHCSVTDIKGGEWAVLKKYLQTLEIDMSGDSARFVNLLRLDNLGCNEDNCREAYDSAVNNTIGLFEVCTNLQPYEGNEADLRSILAQAVEKVFSSNGVVKTNPKTFSKTRNLNYSQVLVVLSDLESSRSYTDAQKQICKIIRTRCAPYFMSEGRYSSAFKNELTVADVLDTPLVIYNFNKNTGEALDVIDNVRIFMSRCLDSRKHFIRKQKKLHQAAFFEELQRCGSMKTLINNISSDVTGSRSNNLSVFLLLNAVSTFDADNFSAIRSNITTAMVGKCSNADIKKLVSDYDCETIENYMQLIRKNDGGKYNNCFAISYDVGNDKNSLIAKTVIPQSMAKDFSTRDILKI